MSRLRALLPWVFALLAIAYLAWIHLRTGGLPFFSSDYTLLAGAPDFASTPLWPLERLVFAELAGGASSGWARALGIGLHAFTALAVFGLARAMGLARRGATCALLLFLVFPNVREIVWSSAIGTLGATAFGVCALAFFVRRIEGRGSFLGTLLGLASFAVALACHPGALVIPVLLAAWCMFPLPDGESTRGRAATLIICAAVGVIYASISGVIAPLPELGGALGSGPAWEPPGDRALRSALLVLPEGARLALLPHGLVAGGVVAIGALVVAWVGDRALRWSVLAVGLALAVAWGTAGQRPVDAYAASVFCACGLGAWWDRYELSAARTLLRAVAIGVLACAWFADSLRDLASYQEAGATVARVVDRTRLERQRVTVQRPVVVVDAPAAWGRERDLPVFDTGLPEAVRRSGAGGIFHAWRTRGSGPDSSTALPVEAEDVAGAARGGEVVLEYDSERHKLWRVPEL